MRKHVKLIRFLIFILIVSGAGLFGYMTASNEPRLVKSSPSPSAAPAGVNDSKVKEGAEVDWDYEYNMCAHHIYAKSTADSKMVGLTLTQFQAEYPQVRIISFDPDKLVLRMSFDCYCPDHYMLRHYKDELAVFKTILGTSDQEVYIEVPIKFSNVPDDEKDELEAGKLFGNLDDLENYLENIEQT